MNEVVKEPEKGKESTSTVESVPKYRMDEVLESNRQLKEEIRFKNEALVQFTPRPQTVEAPVKTAEDYNLDDETFKAAKEIASELFDNKIGVISQEVKGQLAILANKNDQIEFVQNYGKENKKYLPKIKEMQTRHAQTTGSFLDMDTAYKMIRYDEMTAKEEKKAADTTQNPDPNAQNVQNVQTTQQNVQNVAENVQNVPNQSQTQVVNAPNTAVAQQKVTNAAPVVDQSKSYIDQEKAIEELGAGISVPEGGF